MIKLAKNAERYVKEYILTRYACYLIVQNGDSRKNEIAFAQSYFAVQTRKQEIIEDRIKLIERLNAREKLKEAEKILSQNVTVQADLNCYASSPLKFAYGEGLSAC